MYNKIQNVRVWVQKVLPLVYDDSLSYYEQLCRFKDKLNEVIGSTNEYGELYAIKIADPIEWNIAEQYQSYTIVTDSVGKGYISRQPVPAGVLLSNENYWTPIFDLEALIDEIRSNIAYNAGTRTTTEIALKENNLVWWNGNIYKVLYDIAAGTAFIEGTNVEKYTVNERIQEIASSIENEITNRIQADETLATSIQNEANTRASVDSALQNNIDNVNTTLTEEIQNETTERETADDEIRSIIEGITRSPDYYAYNIAEKIILAKFEKTGSYQLTDNESLSMTDLLDSFTGYGLQSCEYIGQNRLLFGFSKTGTYNDSVLVVVNTTTWSVVDRVNIDLGHCNDLAYDNVRGKIYVATMGTGSLANTISILNSNNLNYDSSISVAEEVYKIAYDKLNDVVYDVRKDGSLLRLEIRELPSLSVIESYTLVSPTIEGLTSQGSVCIDGNFYYVDTVYGATNYNAGVYLTNYKPDGSKGKCFAFNSMAGDEAEGVTFDDQYIYIASYNYVTTNIHVYKYALNNNSSNQLNTILSGYGKELKEGDNLNNMIDGKYIKVSASIAVTNWPPQNSGGTIIQVNGGYDHTFQIALLNNGQFYSRTRLSSGTSGSWTAWRNLNGAIMKGYYSFDLAGAYISDALRLIVGTIPMELFNVPDFSQMALSVRSVTGAYVISGQNLSNYNYVIALQNGLGRLSIRNRDGSAFTNATNNTPVATNIVGTV